MNNGTIAAAVSPPVKQSRLGRIIRGKLIRPIRLILYATDGLGKTTFASNSPAPVFIGSEDGTAELDVARMPNIETWGDILDSVQELIVEPHDFQTIVLDTADWAEPMCWDAVIRAAGKKSIEDLPYGKGYVAALDQWRILLSAFERAREKRGMNIILLAHAWIKTFKNPEEGGDFDRYEMKLHAKAGGLLKEWADCVLFGKYETFAVTKENRTKGVSSGARLVHTQRRAAWDAKNRYDLPETLPLDWEAFAEAVAAHRPADPALLRTRIIEMIASVVDPILKTKVEKALGDAGDEAAKLAKIADKLSAMIQTKEVAQ